MAREPVSRSIADTFMCRSMEERRRHASKRHMNVSAKSALHRALMPLEGVDLPFVLLGLMACEMFLSPEARPLGGASIANTGRIRSKGACGSFVARFV